MSPVVRLRTASPTPGLLGRQRHPGLIVRLPGRYARGGAHLVRGDHAGEEPGEGVGETGA
ncbi:hypothetical protein [Streptomyces hiroshimensis]